MSNSNPTTPNAATGTPAETDEQAIARLSTRADEILEGWGDGPLPPIHERFQQRWRSVFGPVFDLKTLSPRKTHALMMATVESLQHAIHRRVQP